MAKHCLASQRIPNRTAKYRLNHTHAQVLPTAESFASIAPVEKSRKPLRTSNSYTQLRARQGPFPSQGGPLLFFTQGHPVARASIAGDYGLSKLTFF